MSSKRHYFRIAYGIEEIEEKAYIDDVEKEAALLDGAGTELMAEESANDKLMNTLVEDSKTVSDMYGIMEKGIETTDGINSDTEAVVATAIESILRRHGMKRYINLPIRPSIESFDSRRGRLQVAENLRVSLESIFEKIKEGILKVWQWLKDLWTRFFGKNNKKTLATIEEMVEYISSFCEKIDDKDFEPAHIVLSRNPDKGGEEEDGKAINITDYFSDSRFDKYLKSLTGDYEKFLKSLDAIVAKNKATSTGLSSAIKETQEKNFLSELRTFDSIDIKNKTDLSNAINLIHKKIIPSLKELIEKYKSPINDKMAAAESVIQQIAPGVEEAENDRGIWGNIIAKFGVEKPQDVLRIIRKQSTVLTKDINGIIKSVEAVVRLVYKKIKATYGSLDNK